MSVRVARHAPGRLPTDVGVVRDVYDDGNRLPLKKHRLRHKEFGQMRCPDIGIVVQNHVAVVNVRPAELRDCCADAVFEGAELGWVALPHRNAPKFRIEHCDSEIFAS